jgi:hypothetical protein
MQAVLDHMWTHLLPALGSPPRPQISSTSERLVDPRLPTAADRLGTPSNLDPAGIAGGRSIPAPPHGRTLRSLTAVDVTADHLVLHEKGASITAPISTDWTDVPDAPAPLGASATVDANGHLVVDLALLATPHRLELTVDPASRTFDATWPAVPLFGAGLEPALTRMHPPAD